MKRTIEGFRHDGAGEWVAELSCLHGQHVRHRPPFQERPFPPGVDHAVSVDGPVRLVVEFLVRQ